MSGNPETSHLHDPHATNHMSIPTISRSNVVNYLFARKLVGKPKSSKTKSSGGSSTTRPSSTGNSGPRPPKPPKPPTVR